MSRFGLKTLFLIITYVALWASTFTNYSGVEDVRAFVMTSVFVGSGVAAYSYSGKSRAFWLGFFGTLLVFGSRRFFDTYSARFTWARSFAMQMSEFWSEFPQSRGEPLMGVHFTLIYGTTLIAAALIGLLCMYIYEHAQNTEDKSN
jgi:hypothetical protein